MTRPEVETVAGYPLKFLDEVRFQGLNFSGCGEVERLCRFQVAQGEDLRPATDERGFELVPDEALPMPTEGMVVTGEGGRQTLLGIDVEKAVALFEWIGAASHAVGRKRKGEWPAVPIGFHFIRSLKKDLPVLE